MKDILVYMALLFFGYHFGTGIGEHDWIKVFICTVSIVGLIAIPYDTRRGVR